MPASCQFVVAWPTSRPALSEQMLYPIQPGYEQIRPRFKTGFVGSKPVPVPPFRKQMKLNRDFGEMASVSVRECAFDRDRVVHRLGDEGGRRVTVNDDAFRKVHRSLDV